MKLFIKITITIFIFANSFCYGARYNQNYLDIAALFKEAIEYDRAIGVIEGTETERLGEKQEEYLGVLYYLAGKPKRAISILDKVEQKNWIVFLYLGLAYEDLDKDSKAKEAYLKSLDLQDNSIAFYRLAKIHYNKKSYSKAKHFFSQLIELDPSIRLAYYYLGDCFFKEKNFERAYHYFSKAINFYPQNKKVEKSLNLTKKKLGDKFFTERKETKETTRKKVRLSPYTKEVGIPEVKVGLAKNLKQFSFRCGEDFIITDGQRSFKGRKDKFYTFAWSKKGLKLKDYKTGSVHQSFQAPIKISAQSYPFYLLDVTYGEGDFWHKEIDRIYRGNLEVMAASSGMILINILSIEEYLYGVLPSEISYRAHPEALKAQAVAARTIALRGRGRHRRDGFDFCADVHCQVYQGLSVERDAPCAAVRETKGETLLYQDKPVEAFYHSNCGGCLRSDVFGQRDYLVSKIDNLGSGADLDIERLSAYQEEMWFKTFPQTFSNSGGSNFRWQRAYDAEDFELVFGFSLDDLKEIVFLEKGDCFRYQKMQVTTASGNENLVGDLTIRNFFDKLRSGTFKMEIKYSAQKTPQMILFWGAGFGHGVGLSQEGAENMADKGLTYRQILKHYYPNTNLKKMY